MSRHKATLQERGNGLAGAGEYVTEDGVPYLVVRTVGPIRTGSAGVPNYQHAIVEDADWSDIADDEEPYCTAVVGEADTDAELVDAS